MSPHRSFKNQPYLKKNLCFFLRHLAGVELEESLLPKMALYCGGPPGGAANTRPKINGVPVTQRQTQEQNHRAG